MVGRSMATIADSSDTRIQDNHAISRTTAIGKGTELNLTHTVFESPGKIQRKILRIGVIG